MAVTTESRHRERYVGGNAPHWEETGNVAGASQEQYVRAAIAPRGTTKLGPFERVHVFWLAGMSCDGCSIAVLGATAPSVESLLTGTLPGVPLLLLHHTAVQVEAGEAFMEPMRRAARGELEDPYVVVFEGSCADEDALGEGYWSAIGEEVDGNGGKVQVPSAVWLRRLAPGAAAIIAIGTCATWGGIPAAINNVTDSMSVADWLGRDYRSALGLPVVNVPGCSPVGDNFTETVAVTLLFLQGLGPAPELDELGRPAWLFGETVHRTCTRAGFYEEGSFAKKFGDKECLVEIGCWGPVVQCNITSRGAINHMGGCMNVGGACIGCTMPGFPDKFTPFYKAPPGTMVSGTGAKILGGFVRPLRLITQRKLNREVRWDTKQGAGAPPGWGAAPHSTIIDKFTDTFYEFLRHRGAYGTTKKAGKKRWS
ncbi:MAG: hydrogenase expression protein HypE [Actinobacteria bacterium]|nr:hydrogenase expression protein HypE [Actinomycetota bacterium]